MKLVKKRRIFLLEINIVGFNDYDDYFFFVYGCLKTKVLGISVLKCSKAKIKSLCIPVSQCRKLVL